MRSVLGELERLSVDDPKEAIRRVAEAMTHAEPHQMPSLYGVCGSAYRRQADLDTAFFVLHEGITIARRLGDLDSEARLIQRTAYVYGDRGDFTRALRATESAIMKFISAGNLSGASRAMLDQGQWLYYLGRLRRSIRICRSTYRALAPDEIANRFASLQGISLCYADLNQPRRAIRYARLARTFEGAIGPSLWSKQLWLEARILRQLKDFRGAEDLLQTALQHFLQTESFLDVALACVDLTQLSLESGRFEDAQKLAKSFGKLLIINRRLADNEVAASALMALARCAVTGKNLRLVVSRVKKRLEQAKAHSRR